MCKLHCPRHEAFFHGVYVEFGGSLVIFRLEQGVLCYRGLIIVAAEEEFAEADEARVSFPLVFSTPHPFGELPLVVEAVVYVGKDVRGVVVGAACLWVEQV